MSTQKNLITLCFATVFTLGLAACGGGGGGGGGDGVPVADINGKGPPPIGPACATSATSQACVDDKKMALDEAMKALDAAEADGSSTLDQIKAAEMAVDDAQMAYDDAMEDRATYLAMQPPMYDMEALAKVIVKAINEPFTPHTVAGAIDGGAPPRANEDYAKATWPVGDVAGFAEAVYEDASAGTAIVTHTDKQAAKFSVYYATPAGEGQTTTMAAPDDPPGYMYAVWKGVTAISEAGVFDLKADVTGAPISVPHGAASDSTKTFADDPKTDANELMMKGSFHGMPGTYACTESCSVGTNAKGELITLSEGWTFTPTKGAADIIVDDVLTDASYLDFGYWVTTMAGPDGPTYSVGTFANSMGDTTERVMGLLTGQRDNAMSATYKGGAAGLYAKREYSGTSDGDLLGAGRFTATAELKAYFGMGTHTAGDDHNRISGMISNFRDGDSPIDATWRVKLGAIDFSSSTNGSFADPLDSWSGQFIGGSGDSADVVTAPTGVAGEFTHVFDNGNVIGAFGATR